MLLGIGQFVADNIDPNSGNNRMIVEINVIDRNDPPQSGPEYLIRSVKPKLLTISKGRDAMSRSIPFAVANTGTGEQRITVTLTDTDCPPGTFTGLTLGRTAGTTEVTATLRSGAALGGKLQVALSSEAFHSPSKTSPGRCHAGLTASSPGGDTDASNNHTQVQVTVLDKNDL